MPWLHIPDVSALKQDDYFSLLGAAMPSIVLHGIYDAFCFHDIPLSWGVGIVSLVWGFSILGRPMVRFSEKLPDSPREAIQ